MLCIRVAVLPYSFVSAKNVSNYLNEVNVKKIPRDTQSPVVVQDPTDFFD